MARAGEGGTKCAIATAPAAKVTVATAAAAKPARRHGFADPRTPRSRAEATARVVSCVIPSMNPADAKNKLQYAWNSGIWVSASRDHDATHSTTKPDSAANRVAKDRDFIEG